MKLLEIELNNDIFSVAVSTAPSQIIMIILLIFFVKENQS